MAQNTDTNKAPVSQRYIGRFAQISIYFGKFLRMFIYQNDWKVLPIAAVIAGLVGMVIKGSFNITREGTLMGSLAVACVCLWNGCFNSIQVICRERPIVKREHHSGMYISSYVLAHLLFQAIICVLQSVITIYILKAMGVKFPDSGLVMDFFEAEFFITLFVVTFSADMMSLFISSLVHTTTAAMTLMPFILIFQLIFSGGMFAIPQNLKPICNFTISNYGIRTIASEMHYNEQPVITGWNTLYNMRNTEINFTTTVDQVLQLINRQDNELTLKLNQKEISDDYTVSDLIEAVMELPDYGSAGDREIPIRFTINDLINLVGPQKAMELVTEKTSGSGAISEYVSTEENVKKSWTKLMIIAAGFTVLTMVSLSIVDKDKR